MSRGYRCEERPGKNKTPEFRFDMRREGSKGNELYILLEDVSTLVIG